MKNVTLKIENNGTFIEFDLSTAKNKSNKKIQHLLVLRFFDWYDTMRAIGAKVFKANQPFKLTMKIDKAVVWDSGQMGVTAQARLKLINTPKGRGNFEYSLNKIIAYVERTKINDIDKAIEKAEKELLLN